MEVVDAGDGSGTIVDADEVGGMNGEDAAEGVSDDGAAAG